MVQDVDTAKVGRAKRRWLLAAAFLFALCSWLGYRQYVANEVLRAAQKQQEARDKLQARLAKTVTLQFNKPVSLRTWLAEFAQQSGFPTEIASRTNTSGEERWFQLLLDADAPMSLNFPPLPAREALDVLGELFEIHWSLDADGVVILKVDPNEEPKLVKHYQVPPAIPLTAEQLRKLLQLHLSLPMLPGFEGTSSIQEIGGALAVVETERAQRRVKEFLEHLATAYERCRGLARNSLDPNDPALEGIWLKGDPLVSWKDHPALAQRVSLAANDMPLAELVSQLSQRLQMPLVIHPEILWSHNLDTLRITCDLQDAALGDAHLEVSGIGTLRFCVLAGGKMLVLTSEPSLESLGSPRALVAYPVADLPRLAPANRSGKQLIGLVEATIFSNGAEAANPFDVALDPTGQLLLVDHRLEVHEAVQNLLSKLRWVRAGQVSQARLSPGAGPRVNSPAVVARLAEPMAFEYRGLRRAEAMQDMFRQGGVAVPAFDGGLLHAIEPVWCYLPEAPLQENLVRFLAVCHYDRHYLDHVQLLGEPKEKYVEQERILQTEVFDLRPWLNARDSELNVGRLLQSVLEQESWDQAGGDSHVSSFCELLVVRSHPRMLQRVRELLPVVSAHAAADQPKVWREVELVGDALNRPLELLSPKDEQVTYERDVERRNRAIEEKLRTPVSLKIRDRTIGEVIVDLAREHQIPLVVHSLPTAEGASGFTDPFSPQLPIRHLVSLDVAEKPLDEVLPMLTAQVVGGEELAWIVRHGCLTIGNRLNRTPDDGQPGWLYSVDDLIAPRGKLLPKQLVRTLERELEQSIESLDPNTTYTHCEFHIGNLLWHWNYKFPGSSDNLQDALRRLRSGELQPVPTEMGDADFSVPYYPDSEWGPYTVPVVGSRESFLKRRARMRVWSNRVIIDR